MIRYIPVRVLPSRVQRASRVDDATSLEAAVEATPEERVNASDDYDAEVAAKAVKAAHDLPAWLAKGG